MAAKLFEKLPAEPAVRSSALVLAGTVIHVTRMLVLVFTMEVMPRNDALLVGFVPAWNSCRLVKPSPSLSVPATVGSNRSKPNCCFQLHGRPSPATSRLGRRFVDMIESVPPVWMKRP